MDKNKVIDILSALAEGIDPYTGEMFPDNSPYNNADTVRALFLAIETIKGTKTKKPKSEDLENSGKPWPEQEDEDLKNAFLDGEDVKSLATKHKRTKGAIQSRLEKHQFIDRFGKRIVHASK